jgi:hypothetical protein
VVLQEALAILSDFVEMDGALSRTAMQEEAPRRRSFGETIGDWFRGRL